MAVVEIVTMPRLVCQGAFCWHYGIAEMPAFPAFWRCRRSAAKRPVEGAGRYANREMGQETTVNQGRRVP
jgi:hypothetical protein